MIALSYVRSHTVWLVRTFLFHNRSDLAYSTRQLTQRPPKTLTVFSPSCGFSGQCLVHLVQFQLERLGGLRAAAFLFFETPNGRGQRLDPSRQLRFELVVQCRLLLALRFRSNCQTFVQ